MSDSFIEQSKDQQHVLERLIKGLPGIRGYTDKEARRDADYRVRQLIADELDRVRAGLLDCQRRLLSGGGLAYLDDLDGAVSKVQNLSDRVRTASYGYAGFFDAQRIGKEELNALYRFDVAMLKDVAGMETAVASLRSAIDAQPANPDAISAQIEQAIAAASDMAALFDRRARAVESPDLLADPDYAPPAAEMPVAVPERDASSDQSSHVAPDDPSPEDESPSAGTPIG